MKKEEIRNDPLQIYLASNVRYTILGKPKFYVEIELKDDEDNNLFLIDDRYFRWIKRADIWKKPRIERGFKKNIQGRRSFEELVPNFGKVWVNIHGETNPRCFDSYEEFLDEITSD